LVIANTDQLLSKREQVRRHAAGHGAAWRLRMDAAIDMALNGDDGETLSWFDHLAGWQIANPAQFGDVVIARADIAVSYHLSVVIDDALDGVTLVTRGNDLAASTHLHRLLQALFALSVPDYCHHALVLDQAGKRLAKRDSAHSLEMMRQFHDDPSSIFGKIPPIPAVNLHGNT
jgi:glutamyl-Q tRNA(Asp) synthetase